MSIEQDITRAIDESYNSKLSEMIERIENLSSKRLGKPYLLSSFLDFCKKQKVKYGDITYGELLVKMIFCLKPNNWKKLHGFPMRRRGK